MYFELFSELGCVCIKAEHRLLMVSSVIIMEVYKRVNWSNVDINFCEAYI